MRIRILRAYKARGLLFLFVSLSLSLFCSYFLPLAEALIYRRLAPPVPGCAQEPILFSDSYEISRTGWFVRIDLDALKLEVFRDGQLNASFPVSGGKPDTPSPVGMWKIAAKSSWGKGFGGTWLELNIPWGRYGIHGTLQPWYVGRKNSSHGCIRMNSADAKLLSRLVPVKTPVQIIQENAPFRTLSGGMFGSDVLRLQVSLGVLGYYDGPMDGRFGEGTKSALLRFQQYMGLNQTGKADAGTYLLALNLAED